MDPRNPSGPSAVSREQSHHPREFADFVYTYPVISRRSGGVSIGVNLNLDKHCNFDCPYCQVDRTVAKGKIPIAVPAIRDELQRLLAAFDADGVCRLEKFSAVPDKDKRLKDIAVSGDGEPTMVPEFAEVCAMLAKLQSGFANPRHPSFKLVLITNSTLLDRKNVLAGIGHLLSKNGEVWAKLDAGTEAWYQKVNVSRISLDKIQSNLMELGKHHPYSIQSLFCALDGEAPSTEELNAYLERLRTIKNAGSAVKEVQLHTLARKPAQASCTPVTGELLENLRRRIKTETGFEANVYGTQS